MMLRAEHVSYQPTDEDILWLRRAVEAEGPPKARVAATLVNKFMWARARLNSRRTLADHVRRYAQPVNPRWFVGGDKYEEKLARTKSEETRRALRNKALMREHVHSTRLVFVPETIAAVEQALSTSPELPQATDYAAHWADGKAGMVALTPAIPGQNRFWRTPAAETWKGYRVGAWAIPMLDARPSVVALAGIGLVVYWLVRGRHGNA